MLFPNTPVSQRVCIIETTLHGCKGETSGVLTLRAFRASSTLRRRAMSYRMDMEAC